MDLAYLLSTTTPTNQSKSTNGEDRMPLPLILPPPSVLDFIHPPVAADSSVHEAMVDDSKAASSDQSLYQLDIDDSETRNQVSVSDIWMEFFKLYRHPFGRTDSKFQKSSKAWLKGLNKGDPEYICESCTIQPGYRVACDRKSIRCQLCVVTHRSCSRTKAFRKRLIMEKLRLEEKEYDHLVKLVPPRGSGVHVSHASTGIHGNFRVQLERVGLRLRSPTAVAIPISKDSNLPLTKKRPRRKGQDIDRNVYGNGSGSGRRRMKATRILFSESDSHKENQRPTPQHPIHSGDPSTSKIVVRSEYLNTETDMEVIGCHRASKRIRRNLQHNAPTITTSTTQGRRPRSTTTRGTRKAPVLHSARMIQDRLGSVNVAQTTNGNAEIPHDNGKLENSASQHLLGDLEALQFAESMVDLQIQSNPSGPGNNTLQGLEKQVMGTLRAMESTLDDIRESLQVPMNTSTTDIPEPLSAQGSCNGFVENNHNMGANELIGMATMKERLESWALLH